MSDIIISMEIIIDFLEQLINLIRKYKYLRIKFHQNILVVNGFHLTHGLIKVIYGEKLPIHRKLCNDRVLSDGIFQQNRNDIIFILNEKL
jgi:hypothetical protein